MYRQFKLHPVLVVSMIFICSYFGFHPALGLPDISDTDGIDMDGIKLLSSRCRENVLKVHYEIKTNLRETFKKNPRFFGDGSNYDFVTKLAITNGCMSYGWD